MQITNTAILSAKPWKNTKFLFETLLFNHTSKSCADFWNRPKFSAALSAAIRQTVGFAAPALYPRPIESGFPAPFIETQAASKQRQIHAEFAPFGRKKGGGNMPNCPNTAGSAHFCRFSRASNTRPRHKKAVWNVLEHGFRRPIKWKIKRCFIPARHSRVSNRHPMLYRCRPCFPNGWAGVPTRRCLPHRRCVRHRVNPARWTHRVCSAD